MIVGFSIFVIVKRQCVIEIENDKLKMITKIVEYTNEYRARELDNAKEIRKIKHDMVSNLGTIECLIKANKLNETIAFVSKITGEVSAIDITLFTEYQYLNALLNFKKNLHKNIYFDYQIDTLQMNQEMEFDCCTIISSLLDNSIDELERNDKSQQMITLKIKDVNGNIIINAVNDIQQCKNLITEKVN